MDIANGVDRRRPIGEGETRSGHSGSTLADPGRPAGRRPGAPGNGCTGRAQEGRDGYYGLWIDTADGADPEKVADAVAEVLPAGFVAETSDELAARIRTGTTEMADPPATNMFDVVYAEQTPPLAAQRAEFVAYQAGFEGEH